MLPRLILDTHILIRWLGDQKKLSRQQTQALQRSVHRAEPIALSAISLIEIALLVSERKMGIPGGLAEFLSEIRENPVFRVLPITFEVALEVASLGSLRDPMDRTIVATARVDRLALVTSDQRIIGSQFVRVID